MAIPIIPELQRVIGATKTGATKTGGLTFLLSDWGRPFKSANSFGNKFRAWCDAAGLPQCSCHGLRKAISARLGELGCNELQIMAITGHTSLTEVTRYTRGARKRLLAKSAMEKVQNASGTKVSHLSRYR